MTQAPKHNSLWISPDSVPQPLKAPRFVLEPLAEEHAELDFEALMSCRARLQEELQWGTWPPEDFTLEENRADLRRHHGEFLRGEAFAYTVLSSDRTRCLGCIYLERCIEIDGAQLAFWVIDDAIDMEAELVTAVLRWVHTAWAIDRILIPLREANTRGIALALQCGFVERNVVQESPLSNHRCFLSESGRDEELLAKHQPPPMSIIESKLQLVKISPDNYELAKQLDVGPDQAGLVATLQNSLADAYVYPQSLFRLACVDQVPVGYLLLFPFDGDRGRTVNVVRLMIDRTFQGRGLGRRLLTAVLEWIRTLEPTVETVRVSTLPHNEVALHLYESVGFIRAGMEEGEVALYLALSPEENKG